MSTTSGASAGTISEPKGAGNVGSTSQQASHYPAGVQEDKYGGGGRAGGQKDKGAKGDITEGGGGGGGGGMSGGATFSDSAIPEQGGAGGGGTSGAGDLGGKTHANK